MITGDLTEAERLLREALVIFERTGDVRSRAVTMGKIADILHARGELDEALRIYQEEVIPVDLRLAHAHNLLFDRTRVAELLIGRNQPGDQEAARALLALARDAAARLKVPELAWIESLQQKLA